MTDTLKRYLLVRTDVPRYKIRELVDIEYKFACTEVSTLATCEEEARFVASLPMWVPEGSTIMPDNTIEPPPPYAWCYDSEPTVWLDPKRSECRVLNPEGGPPVGEPRVTQRSFREVPR